MQDVRIKAKGKRAGPGKACSFVEECIMSAPSRSYFIRQRDGEGSTLDSVPLSRLYFPFISRTFIAHLCPPCSNIFPFFSSFLDKFGVI